MKQSILLFSILLLLATKGDGQNYKDRDIEIPIVKAGTAKSPIKLAGRWFEGDTLYFLAVRDPKSKPPGRKEGQAFFIVELQALGKDMQTALALDADYELRAKDWKIELMKSKSGGKSLLIRFKDGDRFLVAEKDAVILIAAIKNELFIRFKIPVL